MTTSLQVEVLYLHSLKHMFLPSLILVFIFFTYIKRSNGSNGSNVVLGFVRIS